MIRTPAILALEDGTTFRGEGFGALATVTGEACFNTSLTGYQEVLTDPSYHGQIVTMTATQIGNTGVNAADDQSRRPWVAGFAVRDISRIESSWRSENSLPRYLEGHGVPGIAEMPTWDLDAISGSITVPAQGLIAVADGIEIAGNLGTLIRTLDGCGAAGLIITNRRTRLDHPKVFRGSQGLSVALPIVELDDVGEAISWLRGGGLFDVYLADTRGASYRKADYGARTAIVFGNERYGISKPWREAGFPSIAVPMLGHADSLNVSVSASVMLYEARAQKAAW